MVRKSWNLSWCHDMIWRGCGKNFTKFLKVITYDAYKPENMRIGFFISCVARIGFKHRTCQTSMKRWEFWSQSQKHYALDLLKIACMEKCRAISASMATTERLSREQGHSLNNEEQFRYRSTVGGLQYLTMTRHDLAFAVNRVSQFIQNPTDIP